MIIYDKTLNNILSNSNLRSLNEPDLKYIGKDDNFCFAKIEFYHNGDIKNYYLSKGVSSIEFNFTEKISKLINSKISSELYTIKSIEHCFDDLSKNEEENNITKNEKRIILNSNKTKYIKKELQIQFLY